MSGFTPESLIRAIAAEVIRQQAATRNAAPPAHEVQRTAPNGQRRTERVILHQAIAELTDTMLSTNELMRLNLQSLQAAIGLLEENRVIGRKMLKIQQRMAKIEDDEA